MRRIVKIVVASVAAVGLIAPQAVLAHDGPHNEVQGSVSSKVSEAVQQKEAELRKKAEDAKNQARQKLDDAKKKICQNREKTVNTRMQHVVEMRTKQIEHIDNVVTKAKAFYDKKGNTAANYDALVAAVDAKLAAAKTALEATKSGATFSCASDGPKADAQAFIGKRNTLVDAIRDYRAAAKELLAGIKTAQPAKEANS